MEEASILILLMRIKNMPVVMGMDTKADTTLQQLQGKVYTNELDEFDRNETSSREPGRFDCGLSLSADFFLPLTMWGEQLMFPKHCSISYAKTVPRWTWGKNVPLPCPTRHTNPIQPLPPLLSSNTDCTSFPSLDLRLPGFVLGATLYLLWYLLFYSRRMKYW